MKALPSALLANVGDASEIESTLDDRRELAFVRFISSAVACATQRQGSPLPEHPIDMKYISEVGRYMYERREMLIGILTKDPEEYLWGE